MHFTPLPIKYIRAMSKEFNVETQNNVANQVLQTYGPSGLLTLWQYQGCYFSYQKDVHHRPQATQWWTEPENKFAPVIQELCADKNYEEGYKLLSNASLYTNQEFLSHSDTRHVTPSDDDYLDWSYMDVAELRNTAVHFFAHILQLSSPLCLIYVESFASMDGSYGSGLKNKPRYPNKIHGFRHDIEAMKYFAMKGFPVPEDAPEWLKVFQTDKDEEWQMYESTQCTWEEAYTFASTRRTLTYPVLELPEVVLDPR